MDTQAVRSLVSDMVQRDGLAQYCRYIVGMTEAVLQDKDRSEMELFVSIYTELLEYPGAPVNNLRHERRKVAAELLQITPSRSRGE
jgi:Asp/Glu/hydantoin racemase